MATPQLCSFLYHTRTILHRSTKRTLICRKIATNSTINKSSSSIDANHVPSSNEHGSTPTISFLKEKAKSIAAKQERGPDIASRLEPAERTAFDEIWKHRIVAASSKPTAEPQIKATASDHTSISYQNILDLFVSDAGQSQQSSSDLSTTISDKYSSDLQHGAPVTTSSPDGSRQNHETAEEETAHKVLAEIDAALRKSLTSESDRPDYSMWVICEQKIFPLIRLLRPAGVNDSSTSALEHMNRQVNSPSQNSFIPSNISTLPLVSKVFPAALLLILRLYLVHYPTSPYVLALLPSIKSLGPTAYVLGATTYFYNVLLTLRWDYYSDLRSMNTLLAEMERNAVGFDISTLKALQRVEQERTADFAAIGKRRQVRGADWWNRQEPLVQYQKLRRWKKLIAAQRSSNEALISSGLLDRARAIATEHADLSAANAENYDVAVAKRVGELGPVTTALKELENVQDSLEELEKLMEDPSSDNELRALAESDIEEMRSSLPLLANNLKTSLIPVHPFAAMPCLIEIRPGAGGSEASLFAYSLLQMYIGLCSRLSYQNSLTSYSADDSAPSGANALTDCLLEVNHPGAYDLLRTEAGVHRVQRVPATEKKGRTHTSAVSVLVLPSLPETKSDELDYDDPESDYYVAPGDVRSETMRARGAGGQHVNKTDSAIRLTHLPSGIVVAMQDSRSQHKNREKAWQVLRSKLAQMRRETREQEMINLRRNVMGGVARTGREDKVRTYNFSQNRVTDHRSGAESADLDGVLAGEQSLETVMDSVREWMRENEVLGMMAEEEAKKKKKEAQGLK